MGKMFGPFRNAKEHKNWVVDIFLNLAEVLSYIKYDTKETLRERRQREDKI